MALPLKVCQDFKAFAFDSLSTKAKTDPGLSSFALIPSLPPMTGQGQTGSARELPEADLTRSGDRSCPSPCSLRLEGARVESILFDHGMDSGTARTDNPGHLADIASGKVERMA